MIPTFSTFSSPAAREICNHLWQSTLFAIVVAVLALALRKYPARARYWLWIAASAKFLVPFSLLIAAGSHLARPTHATLTQTSAYIAIDEMSQPFTDSSALIASTPTPALAPTHHISLATILAILWLCGLLTVLARWLIQWRSIAVTIRNATPLREGRVVETLRRVEHLARIPHPIAVLSSPSSMEPGVFGVFRPVLLWPEAISPHLDDAHLEAVLAHEAAHVRRRDNLTSLLHMLVEAVFWFHPIVWWMESQLVKERERACDEEVLLLCHQPQAYAESILKVCELCIESPLNCVSGITGADLKRRIVQIMTASIPRKLGLGAKLLLLSAATLAITMPILLGQANAAERMMLAAVYGAPMPFGVAARAMIALEQTPSNGLIAELQPRGGVGAALPTTLDATPAPSFDVATIKPSDPSKHPGATSWSQASRDELKMMGSLRTFLKVAYGIEDVQIAGGPKWLDSDLFDIDAKYSSPATVAQVELMLRALLEQRFKLSTHTETKPLPVYSLVVAKGGPKLQQADASGPRGSGWGPTSVRGALNTAQLAHKLTPVLGRTVIDNTGLSSIYKINLTWAADDQPSGPSLFTAIQEQLGLKLEPAKGQVETLVIDHAEKPTTMDGAAGQDQPPVQYSALYSRYATFTNSPTSAMPVGRPQGATGMAAISSPMTNATPAPSFDVATIKPHPPVERPPWLGFKETPDGVDAAAATLRSLIVYAYGLRFFDLVSGCSQSCGIDAYDMQAKMSEADTVETQKLSPAEATARRRLMMQALLAERFKLKVHSETKQIPVFDLVVANNGPKLKDAATDTNADLRKGKDGKPLTGAMFMLGDRSVAQGLSMKYLANVLSGPMAGVARPVIDKTGLTGTYDFTLHWSAQPAHLVNGVPTLTPQSDDALSIFDALKEIGLKLQPATGPIAVIVIDRAEKPDLDDALPSAEPTSAVPSVGPPEALLARVNDQTSSR